MIFFRGWKIDSFGGIIAYFIWGAEAEPFRANLDYIPRLSFPGDIEVPESYVLTAIISVALMAALHYFLRYTKTGLAVRAVAHNKDIAYLMGINVPLMISLIFGLACGLGAAAGVLIGPMQSVQVEMGYLMLMKAFAARFLREQAATPILAFRTSAKLRSVPSPM